MISCNRETCTTLTVDIAKQEAIYRKAADDWNNGHGTITFDEAKAIQDDAKVKIEELEKKMETCKD